MQEVLDFWFKELSPEHWYKKDDNVDKTIIKRFTRLHTAAINGELESWRNTPEGSLAEIIILDQFSRNMFRDDAKSFAYDELALKLAQEAIDKGHHKKLSPEEIAFLIMPYMHSEDPNVHVNAIELFSMPGLEYNLKYEMQHKEIIDKFGRYPHRNKALGRDSTEPEIEFLKNHNGF